MADKTVTEYRIKEASSKTGMSLEHAEYLAQQAEKWYKDSRHLHPINLFDIWVNNYKFKDEKEEELETVEIFEVN